jgi:hypothetical protein
MLHDWHDFTFMLVRSKGMFDLSKAKRYVIFSKKPTKALTYPKNNQIFSGLRDYKNRARPFLGENLPSFLVRMRR